MMGHALRASGVSSGIGLITCASPCSVMATPIDGFAGSSACPTPTSTTGLSIKINNPVTLGDRYCDFITNRPITANSFLATKLTLAIDHTFQRDSFPKTISV